MRKIILASMLSLTAFASFAVEPITAGLGTTATAVTGLQGYACYVSNLDTECKTAISSSAIAFVAFLFKEEIAQVQPDAHNFLVGEEISLALADQMNAIRNEVPEASDLSDEELAVLMLQISNQ